MRTERDAYDGLSEASVRYLHKPERIERHRDNPWPRTLWTLGFIAAVFTASAVIAWVTHR